MQLRRFTADSTPAALGAVRLALGEDAIILANRRVGNQVEIIATGQMDDASTIAEVSFENFPAKAESAASSLPDDSVTLSEAARSTGGAGRQALRASDAIGEQVRPSRVHRRSTSQTVVSRDSDSESSPDRISSLPGTSESNGARRAADAMLMARSDRTHLNRSSDTVKSVIDSIDTSEASFPGDTRGAHTNLLEAMESQSELISQHFRSLAANLWGNNSPNNSVHLQRLISLGIGAELAVRLVERADPTLSVEHAMRHSLALLKTTLPIGSDKTFDVPGVTITSGPPGVGKTTVLVKIAAQHVKQCGTDSIVLICADTRRIGAFEELQAYGRILGVPTVHAHDTDELQSLLAAFTSKQLVLIDHTMHRDTDAVRLPQSLLDPQHRDTVRHLFVLAAGMQSAMADSLISRNCKEQDIQCVLTHLDTAARLGELFNPIIRHHLPIAYWADVASVQQPLQKADASVLVATAVAMRRRIEQSPDDTWLHRLIQPDYQLVSSLPGSDKKSRTRSQ